MTTTEALPSFYVLFIAPVPLLLIYAVYKFFARAQMKADYYPEHWKDTP
jgi:hypothetical protein